MVHLNAMFALLDSAAHERSWALQLWACPDAPYSSQDLAGHIVAEVPLPPMGELTDETEHFEVSAVALPPADGGEHVMVLVLVSGCSGQFNDVQDFAVYPNRQLFIQPRISGNVGYRIDGARVQITTECVENPRTQASRSGTLSLELWALSAPFAGGHFHGHHLAGVEIGSINGQDEWTLRPIEVAFTAPPAGTWQIVLMLREWTAGGFVTRDFTNFSASFVSAPVVEKTPELMVQKRVAPVPAKTPAPVPATAIAPVVAKAPAPVTAKTTAQEVAKVVAPVSPAKARAAVSTKGVSINTARVEELAAVKGLTANLAKGIVKGRPFASLDDLTQVKGLGEKILAKVRSSLKL